MDKASQPAHCPYVLHGGRYRSLPVSRLFGVYTVHALAAQTHLRVFAGQHASPRCVTIIENTGFLATQHHMVAFKVVIDHISPRMSLNFTVHRLPLFRSVKNSLFHNISNN